MLDDQKGKLILLIKDDFNHTSTIINIFSRQFRATPGGCHDLA